MEDIKKTFENFLGPNDPVSSLKQLHQLPMGFAKVAKALKEVYLTLGFNKEGLFPSFRAKIEDGHLVILNLSPSLDVVKLLINQTYIQDRYDKKTFKIGSKIKVEDKIISIDLEDGPYNIPLIIEAQLVYYKISSEGSIPETIFASLMNDSAKLLTYELVKQLHWQLKMPSTEFDRCANSITRIYQPLFYAWLNHLHKPFLNKKAA